MSCPEQASLVLFLRGELAEAEVGPMQDHLAECAECLTQLVIGAAGLTESSGVSSPWLASRLQSMATPELSPTPREDSGAPPIPTEIQTELGPFTLERELGRGGMGVVYRARDTRSGAAVALKTVRTATRGALESLRREILFLAEASHPGLVSVLDYDITRGDPWYAMELLEGQTLAKQNAIWWQAHRSRLGEATVGALPEAGAGHLSEVLTLFRKLCEPLDFVHRAGIVHCDLKPSNVFLRHGREPVLMDFGLAVQARGSVGRESFSLASRGRGTLPYMSPEVITGKIPDARADLYALGCMLYESLVGVPPFMARREELLDQHLHAPVVRASSRVSGLPPTIDELLLALLAKDPRVRLGEAMRVADILDACGAKSTAALARPRAHLYRPGLVGRDADQKIVAEHVDQAIGGRGSLLLLHGESGIGKTFLVSEVAQHALLRGVRVLIGECEQASPSGVPVEAATRALHPFSNLFNLVRDECRRVGADAAKRLPGDFPNILALYSPALAALPELRDARAPAALPDAAGRERLLAALRTALRALSRESPLLLVLDDLQWADELSLAFLESLKPEFLESVPVLIIGTFRTDEPSAALERLTSQPGLTSRRLARLSRSHLTVMVGQMLGMSSPPTSLLDFLDVESEGVPFFVAEYLRVALAERVLAFADGTWSFDVSAAKNTPELSFPVRLKELVRRRVGGLDTSANSCLEAGAVLGRDFETGVLARCLGCAVEEVEDHLRAPLQRGVVERSVTERYRFAHDKFREVIYENLNADRKLSLHAAAGRALEALLDHATSQLNQYFGTLAFHFRRGGQPERALDYLDKGGRRALAISADAEAIGLLTEALELEPTLAKRSPTLTRASWERGVADALASLGRVAESDLYLRRAASLLGRPMATNTFGAVLNLLKELARRVMRRIMPAPKVSDDPASVALFIEEGRVFERFHRTAYFTGKPLDIFVGSLRSLSQWERARPGAELTTAYANAAQLCGVMPAHAWARAYLEKANGVHAIAPDPAAETLLRLVEGVYYMGLGEAATASRQIERGIHLAENIGFHRRREECLAVRAGIDVFAGHWSKAAPWNAALESSARSRGDKQMLCWSLNQKLECTLLRGRLSDVTKLVEELNQLLPSLNDPDRLWTLGLSAHAFASLDRFEAAFEVATTATELARRVPPVYTYCIGAYDRLSETWLMLIDWHHKQDGNASANLLRHSRDSVAGLTRAARAFPLAQPLALLQQGRLELRRGRLARAVQHWRRGLDLASKMQLDHQEARLSQALANTLDPGAEREALECRAQQALARLDLPPESGAHNCEAEAPVPQVAMYIS